MPKLIKSVTEGKYNLETEPWTGISSEAKDLLVKLLEVDPEKRLSAEEALKHPWLN